MHDFENDDVYEILRKRLDCFPTSFPKTDDGTEIQILKRLFTKEEAEIAGVLPLFTLDEPENAQTISRRMGKDANELGVILDGMAKNGLAYVEDNVDIVKVYALLPFIHGSWEFNIHKFDSELAQRCDDFVCGPLASQKGATKLNFTRIIPVSEAVSRETLIRPYHDVIRTIESATSFCVIPCVCRTQTRLAGKGCGHPEETCLFLNDYAEYLNRIEKGRRLTKDEAITLMTKCEEAGLIHISDNVRQHTVICSCCPCSCTALRGLVRAAKANRIDVVQSYRSYFRLIVDQSSCTGCESCIERCCTEALSMKDDVVVHEPGKCLACGACVTVCPTETLSLARKPEKEPEAPTANDLGNLYTEMGWRDKV
ncbi:MAG: 4Fe-4S binding protein [Syntrophales bacterium]